MIENSSIEKAKKITTKYRTNRLLENVKTYIEEQEIARSYQIGEMIDIPELIAQKKMPGIYLQILGELKKQ